MRNFKFFDENDEEEIPEGYVNLEDEDIASWTWAHVTPSNYNRYVHLTVESNGIVEFLRLFHPQMIVPVTRIIGPNNITHTGHDDDPVGWGFNIQTDPLIITYLNYEV